QQARGILSLMAQAHPEAAGISKAIADEAGKVLLRSDSSLFHDYLPDVYEPVYFREFVAHAARHGLAYADDSSVAETWNPQLAPEALEAVRQIAAGDRLLREQYLDLLRVRFFRCSLLCHAAASPQPGWIASHASEMFAASATRETSSGVFITRPSTRMETAHEGVMGSLRRCAAAWPQPIPIPAAEAEMAVALFQRGLIDLRTVPGEARRAGANP